MTEPEFSVQGDPRHLPLLLRKLTGSTPTDTAVDALPIPPLNSASWMCVHLIRGYRCHLSPRLGDRCVFEPSCSRFAELAVRNLGMLRAIKPIYARLVACRPNQGGFDLPEGWI